MGLTSRMWTQKTILNLQQNYTALVDINGKGILESMSFLFSSSSAYFNIKIEIDNNIIYEGYFKDLQECFDDAPYREVNFPKANFNNIPIFLTNCEFLWNKINKPFQTKLKISISTDYSSSYNVNRGQISYLLEV
jgi:hypothetical protein